MKDSAQAMLVLFQQGTDGIYRSTGQHWLLHQPITTIGRWDDNDIVIPDRWISRHHARIRCAGIQCMIEDLGSKNGTLLNGEPLRGEAPLSDGAEIRIGDTILTFVDTEVTQTFVGVGTEAVPLRVEPGTREVWVHGEKLSPRLSLKQFDLLNFLYMRTGEAVSKDEIIAAVWPEAESGAIYDYQVDKMVSRVRERIGKDWIETVWGYGYRLQLE
jgi:hypothetical protein